MLERIVETMTSLVTFGFADIDGDFVLKIEFPRVLGSGDVDADKVAECELKGSARIDSLFSHKLARALASIGRGNAVVQ
jgi:hypothetical protein